MENDTMPDEIWCLPYAADGSKDNERGTWGGRGGFLPSQTPTKYTKAPAPVQDYEPSACLYGEGQEEAKGKEGESPQGFTPVQSDMGIPISLDGEVLEALDIYDGQNERELDFCYQGGEKDAVFVAKTMVNAYRTALQNQRQAVDVETLKKTLSGEAQINSWANKGWNDCLDHLKEQGVL